jgi:UDP-2-acetamido-3-amino-2,3-dideoxy-glucuronate N-acetyltransferase
MLRPYQNIYGQIKCGKGTTFGAFVDIGDVEFGEGCKIQSFVSIPSGWKIGNNVFIGPGARLANDRVPRASTVNFKPLAGVIEDGASIGMGALIGAGLRIGKDAMIGMGAVVTKSVPAGETWVGNPARKISR